MARKPKMFNMDTFAKHYKSDPASETFKRKGEFKEYYSGISQRFRKAVRTIKSFEQ